MFKLSKKKLRYLCDSIDAVCYTNIHNIYNFKEALNELKKDNNMIVTRLIASSENDYQTTGQLFKVDYYKKDSYIYYDRIHTDYIYWLK